MYDLPNTFNMKKIIITLLSITMLLNATNAFAWGAKGHDIVAAIAEARDKGDLSENAEYDAAKEAQGLLEMKISQLKATIGDAKIIDTSKLKADTVQILSKVELKNVKTGMKMAYTLVAESEANLKLGKISVNTPIAQGLLGKKVGDVAEITIPQGKISLEILNISF